MAIYTKLDANDIHNLAAEFNLKVNDFKAMGFGSANSNYVLHCSDGEVYILSIAEEQPREHVEIISRLLKWLKGHQFKSADAIKSREDKWSIQFKGKTISLRTFIPGSVIFNLSDGMLSDVGEQLAILHRLPIPEFLPSTHIYAEDKFSKTIGSNVDPLFERWLEQRLELLNQRIAVDLPKGFIHGDLFADNLIFDQRRLEAFIDFEMACHYDLAYDLGMAITGLCSRDHSLDLEKVKALLNAYQFYRDLEGGERELLQTFAELAAVHTASWRFWKFNFAAPTSSKSQKHLEMKQLADHIRSIPRESFLELINPLD